MEPPSACPEVGVGAYVYCCSGQEALGQQCLPCPQQQHLAHLEEKLRLLAQARDEAQGTCIQQKQTVAEAQARASQLSLQVEGQRRRIEELQQVVGFPGMQVPGVPAAAAGSHPHTPQELSNKDQEKVAEVTRVRVELQEQMGRLRAELTAQETLREKVAALERQLKGAFTPGLRVSRNGSRRLPLLTKPLACSDRE